MRHALALGLTAILAATVASASETIPLRESWSLQSSELSRAGGEAVSTLLFETDGWHPVSVPSTVAGALVDGGFYGGDVFSGLNLTKLPGMDYPVGANFAKLPMPEGSPFRASWWYRREVKLPASAKGRRVSLHLGGLNYRANLWVNGKRVMGSDELVGTFRQFDIDLTDELALDSTNVIALEVFAPQPDDLAITWVDWAPAPPDKDMGLWREASLRISGPVRIEAPLVLSELETPSLASAKLQVSADLVNLSASEVSGTLAGEIGDIRFSRPVTLKAGERAQVRFDPSTDPALSIANPRVWWPARLGKQELYDLKLKFDETGGSTSDESSVTFGIRSVTSELTDEGYRLFRVNGRKLLIRGGGWAPDMFMRSSPERMDDELRYALDLGLNTIRLEGKLEDDRFYDRADHLGLLVLAGWCCCDHWEMWSKWKPEDKTVSSESLRDQIRRLRNHPSALAWMNGSDNPPPEEVEKGYLSILKELSWPNPILSSATERKTTVTGRTGVKMSGPYDYVPPVYWLTDTKNGGAYGFNTETSPGAAPPPIESLRRMIPEDHLWPIDDVWNFHGGGTAFKKSQVFARAIEERYGAAKSAEDYAEKAQAQAYEAHRAMFEAYGRNKYHSTGVIQWMLNNAWPSLIWHLYDYYLRPGGSYFGAKLANEPVHIQYSYDDGSVAVVNNTFRSYPGLKARAEVYNLDLTRKFSAEAALDLADDAVARPITIPAIDGLSSTYFVALSLDGPDGARLSTNFYWLSTKPDVLDFDKTDWRYTPILSYADFTGLSKLAPASVSATAERAIDGTVQVTLVNTGSSLAFFTRLKIVRADSGEEVLPVIWQDNYVSLLPGEKRVISATPERPGDGALRLEVSGWNLPRSAIPVTEAAAPGRAASARAALSRCSAGERRS